MEKRIDVGSVLTELGLTKASLEIIREMYEDGGVDTTDKIWAASTITVDAIAHAVKSIDGVMETLKPLQEG
jgi:hypothetical protein